MQSKEKYRTFCRVNRNIPVFAKDWWLDVVCEGGEWNAVVVEKGGKISAVMPYFLRKRMGITLIKQPKLTQTLGLIVNYPEGQKCYKKLSFEKKIIEEILSMLPKFGYFSMAFNYRFENMLPFIWKDFSVRVQYTYVVEKFGDEKLTDNRRRRIKKAIKYGVSVFESDDIEKFYTLNKKTFERQQKKIPYDFIFVKKLYEACKKHQAVKLLFAKDTKENVIAAGFFLFDDMTVYYLMGGIDPNYKDLGGMDLVLYTGIKFAMREKKVFDFEGSMIEEIERYFRSFGAQQRPYYVLEKTPSRLMKLKMCVKEFL
jgi:hypothetical protein